MTAAHTDILPDHILAAVLTLAKRQQVKKEPHRTRLAFRNYDFQLQAIFNDLRKTRKYPILDAFVFSDTGPEPYSPALYESVSRLQLSGLIGHENPSYEVVFLQDAADKFYDEVLSEELKDLHPELDEVASEFLERANIV